MKKSLLCEALYIARSKLAQHPEYRNFIHFTFVVQDNKILEWGHNRAAEPRKHYGYHKRGFVPKLHSELDAYRKARGLLDKSQDFTIINIRLNRAGQMRMSKPCPCCFSLLKALGCRRFYYSSNVGFLSVS